MAMNFSSARLESKNCESVGGNSTALLGNALLSQNNSSKLGSEQGAPGDQSNRAFGFESSGGVESDKDGNSINKINS